MRNHTKHLAIRTVAILALVIFSIAVAYHATNKNDCVAGRSLTAQEKHDCELRSAFSESLEKDPTAYFTKWLVIFTAVLSLVSIVQIGFLIRADVTARISANSARKSAEAAVASEQAYLVEIIESANFDSFFVPGEWYPNSPTMESKEVLSAEISFNLRFKNYGKTPAAIISYSVEPAIKGDMPSFEAPNFAPGVIGEKRLIEYIIEPMGETKSLPIKRVVSRSWSQSQNLVRRSLNIWIVGHITFKDVFDTEITRKFIWRYERPMKELVPVNTMNFSKPRS